MDYFYCVIILGGKRLSGIIELPLSLSGDEKIKKMKEQIAFLSKCLPKEIFILSFNRI
jgi:hypothetical protein